MINPTGISTGEAFSIHVVRTDQILEPGGIASGEAFGSPTLFPITVVPTGIVSGEAVGQSHQVGGDTAIIPTGIASEEAFGSSIILHQLILPSSIDEGVFGTPQLNHGLLDLVGILSEEAFGNACVNILKSIGISSEEAFGLPELTQSNIKMSGEAGITSTAWMYVATGGAVAGGSANLGFFPEVGGDATLGGEADAALIISFETSGGIVLGGIASAVSPSWMYMASGGIIMGGEVGTGDVNLLVEMGGFTDLLLISGGLPEGPETEVIDIENVNSDVVTNCGCNPTPLTIVLTQDDLNNSEPLSNFLIRNQFTLPEEIDLIYNSFDGAWRKNIQYVGIGADSNCPERWNFVFEWICAEQIAEDILPTATWKFSLLVQRKCLVTGEDFDTRLLYTFATDPVCVNDFIFFSFIIDTRDNSVTTDLPATVNLAVLHDGIGLFNSPFWFDNPDLRFNVRDQREITTVNRFDISSIFPPEPLTLVP